MENPLPKSFYLRSDILSLSKELLGKYLFTNFGKITGGKIVETEAYVGIDDKASHAYLGKKSKRNRAMFQEGGIAYVYLCYGMHHLFNVVTNIEGVPHAVLIRAIEPVYNIPVMLERRKMQKVARNLTAGPALLTQALGIKVEHNQMPLDQKIWISEREDISPSSIIASPRVGIAYAQEDALLPYRFRIKENHWTSPAC